MIDEFRRTLPLLPKEDRRKIVLVGLALLAAAFLEVVGVGMVLPFLGALLGEQGGDGRLKTLVRWLHGVIDGTDRQFILTITALFVLVIVLKSAVSFAVNAWANHFKSMAQHRLAVRLLHQHLLSRYEYVSGVNSAELLNLCRHSVSYIYNGVVMPLLILISDGAMVLLTLGLMFVVEFKASLLAALVVGIPTVISHRLLRRRNRTLGQQRERLSQATIKTLQETLGAFKEIKVLGQQDVALRRFADEDEEYMRAVILNAQLAQVPRTIVEIFSMIGVLVFVAVAVSRGWGVAEVVPVLAMMMAGVLRMMPAALRVTAALNTVHFARASVDAVLATFAEQSKNQDGRKVPLAPSGDWVEIVLSDVSFRYEKAERNILSNVNLRLARNETLGIVGASGAGKSTLIDILMGLLTPTAGRVARVMVDGRRLEPASHGIKIGYVSQTVFLLDDTIRRNVASGVDGDQIDQDRLDQVLRLARIDQFVAALPHGQETLVGERGARISGGQRQRLALARALYIKPDLLILDEATSALDMAVEGEILDTLAALQGTMTMVVITHRLSALRICDRVVRVEDGDVRPLRISEGELRG